MRRNHAHLSFPGASRVQLPDMRKKFSRMWCEMKEKKNRCRKKEGNNKCMSVFPNNKCMSLFYPMRRLPHHSPCILHEWRRGGWGGMSHMVQMTTHVVKWVYSAQRRMTRQSYPTRGIKKVEDTNQIYRKYYHSPCIYTKIISFISNTSKCLSQAEACLFKHVWYPLHNNLLYLSQRWHHPDIF